MRGSSEMQLLDCTAPSGSKPCPHSISLSDLELEETKRSFRDKAEEHRIFLSSRVPPSEAAYTKKTGHALSVTREIERHAQICREKVVRKVVVKRRQALKQLLTDFGENRVVVILRHLLEKRIFESDNQARAHFPELYCSSAAQNAQRADSESDAARSAAELIDEIESTEGQIEYTDAENKTDPDGEEKFRLQEEGTQGSSDGCEALPEVLKRAEVTTSSAKPPLSPPSLYPLYFSYATQHKILTVTQSALEECCFEFAQKWLPKVLAAQHWECAAAVELTRWSKIFKQHSSKIPSEAVTLTSEAGLSQILAETQRVRYAAVHRLHTTARGISKFVLAALQLSQTLQNAKKRLNLMNCIIRSRIKSKLWKPHKNALEDNLRLDLESITARRKEMDQQEKDHIEGMLLADHENKMLIANVLGDTV